MFRSTRWYWWPSGFGVLLFSGTFAWLLSRGLPLVLTVSTSVNRGMSDVLRLLADRKSVV